MSKKYKQLRYQKKRPSGTREFYKLSDKKKRKGIEWVYSYWDIYGTDFENMVSRKTRLKFPQSLRNTPLLFDARLLFVDDLPIIMKRAFNKTYLPKNWP